MDIRIAKIYGACNPDNPAKEEFYLIAVKHAGKMFLSNRSKTILFWQTLRCTIFPMPTIINVFFLRDIPVAENLPS